MTFIGSRPRKSRKAADKALLASPPVEFAAADAATDVFIALLEAERWLFAAGEGICGGTDPKTASAIEAIRRKVCQQLERLQARAYREFDMKLSAE